MRAGLLMNRAAGFFRPPNFPYRIAEYTTAKWDIR
jgi:hypothetical protein